MLVLFTFSFAFLLQIKLEDVVNLSLFSNSNILFAFNESVFGVFRQDFARGGLQFSNNNLGGDYFVNEIAHGHLDDFYDAQHMTPADAVDNELVDFLCSTFQEPSIIFTIVMLLVLCSCTLLFFTDFFIEVCVLTFVFVFVNSGKHADHRLKQE